MSQQELERVIGRAATDATFRQAVLDNAREACKEYGLSEDELVLLEGLNAETFAGMLDQRISKTGGMGFA